MSGSIVIIKARSRALAPSIDIAQALLQTIYFFITNHPEMILAIRFEKFIIMLQIYKYILTYML